MTPLSSASSEKIRPHHRDRMAVVYIRQSTPQQIERHQESTRLQYALVDHALLLGWPRERVIVIDDDQGRTGSTAQGRLGFQALVADVGLGRVGLVLGIEMSRLARSCCDWYQLIEICALRGTLLGDTEGIYDANCMNDRLLLGLKATISEVELHLIKTRMSEGRRNKAQRGELALKLPRGYVRRPDGSVMIDPDEQVQVTIRLVFALFERYGTISGVLRHLVAHAIDLPDRIRGGVAKGELAWCRPNRQTLLDMLHNPLYAGVYAYGRRSVEPSRQQPGRPGTGRRRGHDLDKGVIFLRDRMPAYISWDRYMMNQEKMAANRSEHLGVPRHGPALLSGLLVCGRCGHRMFTAHNHNGRDLRYYCGMEAASYGAPLCQSLAGRVLDEHVTDLVLQVMTPTALETSLHLAEDLELERVDQHRQWKLRLERAGYEAERAGRQYSAVEPENRLVTRTLERQWEEALATEQRLHAEYNRFRDREPLRLSAAEQEAIRRLAADIPALWRAPTTTGTDRQELVRLLVERIVVTVTGMTETVMVECHWAGGTRTRTEFRRPVRRLSQLSSYDALLDRVAELRRSGQTQRAIAASLNEEGWQPAKRRSGFTRGMVNDLLRMQGLATPRQLAPADQLERQAGEMTVRELARYLGMPHQTLFTWVRQGKVRGRLSETSGHRAWLITMDDTELERLKRLRELATPKSRTTIQPLDT
jgi:DNA invertase Pin-like site-specific DNA recombinase